VLLVVGFVIGAVAGAGGASQQAHVDLLKSRNKELSGQFADAAGRADAAQQDLEDEGERADRAESALKKATLAGEVPEFVGMDINDAESEDVFETYSWRTRPSSGSPAELPAP
jgi:outer membrane murein-binding lipoprotein Lpp